MITEVIDEIVKRLRKNRIGAGTSKKFTPVHPRTPMCPTILKHAL